jgi:hypothetical protein
VCQIPDPATLWRSDLERRYTLATEEIEKLRSVVQELIDLAGPCDAAVDRRWCVNHSQGDCDGEAIMARARQLLEGGK